ncbi:MAG: hypothetical protein WKG07_23770 [Hymenobacter sp.]
MPATDTARCRPVAPGADTIPAWPVVATPVATLDLYIEDGGLGNHQVLGRHIGDGRGIFRKNRVRHDRPQVHRTARSRRHYVAICLGGTRPRYGGGYHGRADD